MIAIRPWCVQFSLTSIAIGLLTVLVTGLSFAHAETESVHRTDSVKAQAKKPLTAPLKRVPSGLNQSIKSLVPRKAAKSAPKRKRRKFSAQKRRVKRKVYPTNRPKADRFRSTSNDQALFQEGERLHFNVKMFNQPAGETILAVGQSEGEET